MESQEERGEEKGQEKKDGDLNKGVAAIDDGEPMNPALNEPDAMKIFQKGGPNGTSVSLERKKELLVQARADRRKWVQQVPLPYTNPRDPNNIWSLEDRLNHVQSSLACKRIPTATKVLSELYGLETNIRTSEEVAQRVDELVRPFLSDDRLLGEDEELLAEAISKDNSEVVRTYHDFWSTLLKPECALLVQGMRNFLGNLEGATMERMSASLKSYLDSTFESLKSHVAWKDRADQNVRRSLESFVYGHVQPQLGQLDWTGLFTMTEVEFTERVTKLQFVQPTHLEIECLVYDGVLVDQLLEGPIEALNSIDQFYSPYEKLQRVLAVFQGVNAALSTALSQNESTERKLPSADDVLPTIILTVLRAKPKHILRNLQLVEVFSPQEYLRGEAGYAYTNLYGAVQFLQDLDMDKPDSLSISPEDFRKGLEQCVTDARNRLAIVEDAKEGEIYQNLPIEIGVHDVREARLRGESVNLEWAKKWQQQNFAENGIEETSKTGSLPEGFSRTYKFMSTRPEDVRLSDLPQLLSEYRMLVHVTEQLIGERAARAASEKKKRESERNQQLDPSFLGIDESSEMREKAMTS